MTASRKHLDAFFALLRAGLFPVHGEGYQDIRIDETTDWNVVYRLAQEQSVQGIVLQGVEELKAKGIELGVPKTLLLQWIGEVQMIEQRNKDMNAFIAKLITKLREADIYALLVKGQGIAQCYEKPLWRSCGDVDLYLSKENYEKAKAFLLPLAERIEIEDKKRLHLGMTIGGWVVELHGTLYTEISHKINRVSDEVHEDIFYGGNVRSWINSGIQVFLPSANSDVIIVFTHYVDHFYGEGVGLRQICDWCRLLFTYKGSLDHGLLESRVRKLELMTEWKAFGTFAVEYLGMPEEVMPFYEGIPSMHRKAEKICKLVIETGNFGHNKDESYRRKYSGLTGNFITAWKRFKEFARIAMIFPWNAPKFYVTYLINRFRAVT